jgi:hypothetical protein
MKTLLDRCTETKKVSRLQKKLEALWWAREGENRLASFDRNTAVPHENAWAETRNGER